MRRRKFRTWRNKNQVLVLIQDFVNIGNYRIIDFDVEVYGGCGLSKNLPAFRTWNITKVDAPTRNCNIQVQ